MSAYFWMAEPNNIHSELVWIPEFGRDFIVVTIWCHSSGNDLIVENRERI